MVRAFYESRIRRGKWVRERVRGGKGREKRRGEWRPVPREIAARLRHAVRGIDGVSIGDLFLGFDRAPCLSVR